MMKREVLTINAFPTPVWAFDDIEISSELKTFCLTAKQHEQASKFSEFSWHSKWYYPDTCNPVFSTLVKTVTNCASVCSESIDGLGEIHMTNFWLNVNAFNNFEEYHTHSDSFLSGVYYVKANEHSGNLSIMSPNQTITYWWGNYTNNIIKRNMYNSPVLEIPPVEKRLILFPSFLLHAVGENLTNELRISIAFNFNLTRKYDNI